MLRKIGSMEGEDGQKDGNDVQFALLLACSRTPSCMSNTEPIHRRNHTRKQRKGPLRNWTL
jgi:hypothetical protein